LYFFFFQFIHDDEIEPPMIAPTIGRHGWYLMVYGTRKLCTIGTYCTNIYIYMYGIENIITQSRVVNIIGEKSQSNLNKI